MWNRIDTIRFVLLFVAITGIICGIIGYIYSIDILKWIVLLVFFSLLVYRAHNPSAYSETIG
jgi:hypothetical protein